MTQFDIFKSDNEVVNPKNTSFNNKIHITDTDILIDVTAFDHTPFDFAKRRRSQKNSEATNVMVADVDNDGNSIIDAKTIIGKMPNIEMYLVPSKSHNVDKAGLTAPRYHIYFPLSRPYSGSSDMRDVKGYYKQLRELFPFFDPSCLEIGRQYFGNQQNPHRKEIVVNEGQWCIDEFLESEKLKFRNPENVLGVSESKSVIDKVTGQTVASGRNEMLFKSGASMKGRGYPAGMVYDYMKVLNKTYDPPLSSGEVDTIFDSLFGTEEDLPQMLDKLDRHYAVIFYGSKTGIIVDEDINKITDPSSFHLLHKNMHIPAPQGVGKNRQLFATDVWMKREETKRYYDVVFDERVHNPRVFNLYKGMVEGEEGPFDLWLEHLRENVCNGNEEEFEYFLNWCAHIVQNPTNKPATQTCIAIKGEKGTGKGAVLDPLVRLFPGNGFVTEKPDDLFGRFNSGLEGKIIVFGDEVEWPGDPSIENVFKSLITSSEMRVEKKYFNTLTVKNAARFLLSTNMEWVVPAGQHERRFVVFEISNARMRDNEYFQAMDKQMKEGGLVGLKNFLLARDISNFDHSKFPHNEAYIEQKTLTFDIVEHFIDYSLSVEDEARVIARIRRENEKNNFSQGEIVDEEASFLKYLEEDETVMMTKKQLFACFEAYRDRHGKTKDKQYPITWEQFFKRFHKKMKLPQWKEIKKMIHGVDYYILPISELQERWKEHKIS